MKLDNRTPYDTRVLRSIMLAVMRDVAATRGKLQTDPKVKILKRDPRIVTYGDVDSYKVSRSYTGRASLRGYYAVLSIPSGGLDVGAFAGLWLHELWHLYGIRHKDMPRTILWSNQRAEHFKPYVERFGATLAPLPPKPVAVVAPIDKAAEELGRLEEWERRWKTKAKRAATALTKIRRSRKYYETKLAKAAQPAEPKS